MDAFILSTPAHDPFFQNPAYQSWFRFNCYSVAGYSPSFDAVAQWHPRAFGYVDLYAIYDSALVQKWANDPRPFSADHPDWLLRDLAGNPLKINWAEADGSFHQYAADITHPGFREFLLAEILALRTKGYHGVYLDDVNLEPSFVNMEGKPAALPYENWPERLVDFLEDIRVHCALSGFEIIHNPVWFAPADKSIQQRQILAADYINIERGSGDPNLKPADHAHLAQYIAQVHNLKRSIIMEEYTQQDLAEKLDYFEQVAAPGDLIAIEDMLPNAWQL